MNGSPGRHFCQGNRRSGKEKGINLKEDLAGVVLETFQGWAAMFYPEDFSDVS